MRPTLISIGLIFLSLSLAFPSLSQHVGFTQGDLDLVKGACLAGDNFQFNLKANGNISVRNLEGGGELDVNKKNVSVVSVPGPDMRAEFDAIRACIKDYLTGPKSRSSLDTDQQFLVGQYICKGSCQRPDGSAYITLEGGQLY